MRPDRIITLNIVQPCRRMASHMRSPATRESRAGQCLPILMYHSIADEPEETVSPYYRTATSPELFAAHLAWLRAEGYEVLGLQAGLEKFQSGSSATNLAVITFDDGFRNFYTAALPALRQHNCGATVFLPTAFIGQQRLSFKDRECMTWDEVRESQRAGIEFGSHTVNHPKLYELDWSQIGQELTNSKSILEEQLQVAVNSFAYPYAFPQEDRQFVARLKELLKGCGYQNCVTTVIGRADVGEDLFCLKRLPANSCDDQPLFVAKLNGDYEWLSLVQSCVRRSKFWKKRRIKV